MAEFIVKYLGKVVAISVTRVPQKAVSIQRTATETITREKNRNILVEQGSYSGWSFRLLEFIEHYRHVRFILSIFESTLD